METKTDTPNNNAAASQQPAAPVAPKPAEPTWYGEAWDATKYIAGVSATEFTLSFAKAAGIALGVCVVAKAFGLFDQKAAE